MKRKAKPAIYLTLATFLAVIGLTACGDTTMMPEQPLVYSFKHQLPESYEKRHDLSSDEIQAVTDEGIVFIGVALKDIESRPELKFDIGVQFETKIEGQKVFVETLYLDTPSLKTETDVNEMVAIDNIGKSPDLYWKRFTPIQNISGESIPLTADFFTLKIDYKIDDGPTKQMSIRFDNVSFRGPIL